MHRPWVVLAAIALTTALVAPLARAADPNAEGALPLKATAKPAKPRKVLVFSLARIYAHPSIPLGVKTFTEMGKKTGAWETVASDDPQMFAADKLKDFDAIILNNTSGNLFDDPTLRQNLLDFVKNGKGLVGIHAATDCFHDWKEYGDLIGARFNGHVWRRAVIKLDDPKSPINAAFDGKGFDLNAEIYTFKDPYSRASLHVLMSMDVKKAGLGGDNRADKDYAFAWIKNYGKGRVFYSCFGHEQSIYSNAAILQHWMAGIQFALGDLKADATPSAKVAAPAATK
jgi:uncharacterized protein